jgi:hypothetical protein
MTFTKVTMPVSKREKGEFKPVGEVAVYVPLLAELTAIAAAAAIKKDEKGADIIEDGIPVYEDDKANWVQGAVFAMVKAQARNKLQSGTATLKEGNKIAENWEELTAEGVRDGAGLAIARECKAAFGEWIAKQGLSEAATQTLITLFGNKAALQLQSDTVKDKVKARIMAFGEALSEELVEKYNRPITSVIEACSSTEDALAGI